MEFETRVGLSVVLALVGGSVRASYDSKALPIDLAKSGQNRTNSNTLVIDIEKAELKPYLGEYAPACTTDDDCRPEQLCKIPNGNDIGTCTPSITLCTTDDDCSPGKTCTSPNNIDVGACK